MPEVYYTNRVARVNSVGMGVQHRILKRQDGEIEKIAPQMTSNTSISVSTDGDATVVMDIAM
jgi:hypothetical protein